MTDFITIIDYGAGNIQSIVNRLNTLNVKCEITSEREKIINAKRIIFPGQGHFKQAMDNLNSKNLIPPIKEVISRGTPFLGICLGLQVLFERSEEAPNVEGMGVFKGEVVKFKKGKIPQIGWNLIKTTSSNTFLTDEYFYFVNSYYVKPQDDSIIASYCDYEGEFCASVQSKNVTAVQFHPEKSASAGEKFFKKWLNDCGI